MSAPVADAVPALPQAAAQVPSLAGAFIGFVASTLGLVGFMILLVSL